MLLNASVCWALLRAGNNVCFEKKITKSPIMFVPIILDRSPEAGKPISFGGGT